MKRRRNRVPTRHPFSIVALAALLAACCMPAVASAEEETGPIIFPGTPMTVSIGSRGQCESSYPLSGGNYFPGFGTLGDCGFFLAFPKAGAGQPTALQGQTFGFAGFAGPHLPNEYVPVSQSSVTGSGTEAAPYTETTVFKVVDSEEHEYALITETTTYVNGQPEFTSSFDVKNVTKPATKIYFRAIYAGDLYVNGNDYGTGVFLGGPPRFVGGQNTASGVLGGFQEAPAPALPWSSFQEGCWNETAHENEGIEPRCGGASLTDQGIWNDVRNTVEAPHAFNETVDPAAIDNATGVEWDQLRESGLEAGKEQTFAIVNRTQVPNTLQVSPASQTLTQGQTETVTVTAVDTANQPYAGKTVHYTVAGANPQSGTVVLNSSGQAQISYVGHNAGIDTTQLFVDLGGSGIQTPSDPAGTARVTFVPAPPAPTPNSTYTVKSIKANSDGTITIVFVPTQAGTATLEVTVPTGTIARREALAARRAKRCKHGLVKIKGKCRPKTTVSGRVTATGAAGVPLTLTVKPSGKVVSALKKGKTVHLTATLSYKSSLGGTPTVQVYNLTVKGKRAKHKRH